MGWCFQLCLETHSSSKFPKPMQKPYLPLRSSFYLPPSNEGLIRPTSLPVSLTTDRHPNTVCRRAWDIRTRMLCVFSRVLNGCLYLEEESYEPRWKNCHARSWGVSPAGARACCQACQSEFSSQKWHSRRREVTPKHWPPHTPPRMRSQLNKQMTVVKFLWFDP